MKNLKLPSNRSFGIVFFVFFLILALWPLLNNSEILKLPLILSITFLLLGVFNSKILTPLNKIWMKFGLLLGSIISPIVMGIIFFGIITPTGFILRIFKKDILMLKRNQNSHTYWIGKDNSNNDMKNQF
tara:strand:- start:2360 stop:2746 length:387 start_codon:yes stop_codon:yes gene_type:complete